jgi:hypothetical protein
VTTLTFLERYAVRGASLDVRTPVGFELHTVPPTRVVVRTADESIPSWWGARLVVEAYAAYDVSDALIENLKATAPVEAPNPDDRWDESSRKLRSSAWHWTSGREELDPIAKQLTTTLMQAFRVLRWRMGLSGSHYPFNPVGFFWATPAVTPLWILIPIPGTVSASASLVPRVTPELGQEVVELVAKGHEEPLAHAMLREAWTEHTSNPRSALVLGVAAAEVGLKHCVAALAPETRWLLEETQAPQIAKMLKDYLPKLSDRAQRKPVPTSLRTALDKMATARNHLVHRGDMERDWQQLKSDLSAVQDVLYMFDYYQGEDWALERITSPATVPS